MPDLYPTISQVFFWGVGDIDECAILATYWAARAAGFKGDLPSIKTFRMAAGVPDRPGPTGLTTSQIWRGVTKTGLGAMSVSQLGPTTSWSDFATMMTGGRFASIALDASKLPINLRYGFRGPHQVGLTWSEGQWYIADPLAPNRSAPRAVPENIIKEAVIGFGGGYVRGLVFTDTGTVQGEGKGGTRKHLPPPTPPVLLSLFSRLATFSSWRTSARAAADFYQARRHPRV